MSREARQSKLTPGDRSTIRWHVGRVHVAETDEEVRTMMELKTKSESNLFTPGCIKAMCDYAVKCHHDNQALVKKYHL